MEIAFIFNCFLVFSYIWRTWHFVGLNSLRISFSQICRFASCSDSVNNSIISKETNLRQTWFEKEEGRSLIWIRNQSDPRTEPWGTPEFTGTSVVCSSSKTTVWLRPIRKERIQLCNCIETSFSWIIWSSWFTLSNALLKSKSIRYVCFPDAMLFIYGWLFHVSVLILSDVLGQDLPPYLP